MNQVGFVFRLILFWMIFFLMQQTLFVSFNFSSYTGTWGDLLTSFGTALRMNLAAACYLISIPLLMSVAAGYTSSANTVGKWIRFVSFGLIVINAILLSTDLSLYTVWGTKLNSKALGYVKYPKELMPTVFNIHNLGLFLLIVVQVVAGMYLFLKINIRVLPRSESKWIHTGISVLLLGLLIIGFRGGMQRVPINRNRVFQSGQPVLNYGALNSFWNMADILAHPPEKQGNPYTFFALPEAIRITDSLHQVTADSTIRILKNNHPNIVVVFLESWAGDVIEGIGGEKGVAPKFEELAKSGLLFTRFYSTGYRTEQGFLATLSATPALPVGSIIHSFGKFDKLPNLYRELGKTGYHTSFYSGGRLFFDNIEAYLRAAGVKVLKGEDDWEIKRRTVWGAYDEELFAMHLDELNHTPQPFFSAITTMTTHEWFDADVPVIFKGDENAINDRYRNTVHYADSCLFAYISAASKEPWYDNTLFILVADHACKFPRNRNNYEIGRHHIPCLITGGALLESFKGKKVEIIGSHTDLSATMLAQLGLPHHMFPYSKNLFNPHTRSFAYFAFDNGIGMVTSDCDFLYDHNRQLVTETHSSDSVRLLKTIRYGKAFLQVQFQQNLDLSSIKGQ